MARIAILDRELCKKGMGCSYECMKYCPGVRMGEETIVISKEEGDEGRPVISDELCTGCGMCVRKCPAGAIKIVNLPAEVGKLIFSYGVNSFRLYNLPIPKSGAVVGLVGVNGIGKSTALNMLWGKLKPNLGRVGCEASAEEMRREFSGNEIANYFGEWAKGGMRISHKPQNVDALAEASGNLREFLEKFDERGVLNEAVALFQLGNSLDKEMKSLSGGELQRAALCAAYSKEASFYYFDEPSSYLDIKQRLRAAKVLKKLAEKSAVMVVEHDLAVLDYMSDYVHILYGEPGAYGVVSGLKGVRSGINEYLAGYLKEENLKFREAEIKFEVGAAERETGGDVAFSYGKMRKSYPGFLLECEAGELREGEIVGIIGENAIGKTTFIKLLAGAEKPDGGESIGRFKVSYKPQIVKAEFDGSVGELFASFAEDEFANEVKMKLGIPRLLEREVKKLSGGELQRVALALCLCQKADVYLLDEPSAFLDVEQRLSFAGMLRRVIENSGKIAFVVDHDVALIDNVSDRLVVFGGQSAVKGVANSAEGKRDGMNRFLGEMDVTMRRDKESRRPRVNKPGSQMDEEQKRAGECYYYKNE